MPVQLTPLTAKSNSLENLMHPVKPPTHQAAFTLLELILVVLVVAILSITIQSRFVSSRDFQQDAIVEQIIGAARLTQQLSMNDSSRNFVLVIQANQIDIQVDGNSINTTGFDFPINFGSQVTLSPLANISFNSLGETNAISLSVQMSTSSSICFEASGYIHPC
jgi:MSHA pilin protein MshC